ncbi:hypothetical protein L2E82_49981 [Cichorium intybus]|nr:hypothetical protein L2E82_49981 [Cichorium intybus]
MSASKSIRCLIEVNWLLDHQQGMHLLRLQLGMVRIQIHNKVSPHWRKCFVLQLSQYHGRLGKLALASFTTFYNNN